VYWRGKAAGRLFELHPSLVETGRAAVLDLDLALVQSLVAAGQVSYTPIRRYPASAFDLSVVTGLGELVGDIGKKLTRYAAGDLVSIEFQRQYTGPPLPEGSKSVSFRLTVGADRTLSSEEVSAIRARIIAAMRGEGYELRV
jgi:phenylalanyl-tRNA synthetase beta chain